MITIKELESNGYKKYLARFGSEGLWQKTIYTPEGEKAYFINFNGWPLPGALAFSVEVVLYKMVDEKELRFELNLPFEEWMTVEYVEKFYEEAYQLFNCCPDLYNND